MILQVNIPDELSTMSKDDQEKVIQKMIQVIGETMQNKANVEPSTFFTALSSTIGFLLGANIAKEELGRALEISSRLARHNSMYGMLARQKKDEAEAQVEEPGPSKH